MNEINGFKIDEYNVHGIKTGATTSTCPKCSHKRTKNPKQKCAKVFWDTGLLQCSHCGERIQMHTYLKQNEKKLYSRPIPKPKSKFKQTTLDWFKNIRGISEITLIKSNVTESVKWMPKANSKVDSIEFNYFLHDELINIKSRAKNKDFMFEKNCELIMYNLDSLIGVNECVLVEGEIDALSWIESGFNEVSSVPNGFTLSKDDGTSTINLNYIDDYYFVFENIEKIYLAFDNDAAGLEGQKEFIRRLGAEKCYLIDFKDCKDSNDYLLKYGKEALIQLKEEAKQVPLEDIKTIKDVQDDLLDFWFNGAPKGKTLDLKGFDDALSFEDKQYTLVVAAPGSGKSDLVDYITTKVCTKYGDKVGICSTENKPLKFHYDKLFKKIHGRRPEEKDIYSNIVSDTIDYIDENIFHVEKKGRYYLQDVLAKFTELVKRKGCRWFVLDPFNKIDIKGVSKSNINDYTAEYHQLIDEFCTKNNCHLFLVLHPTKMLIDPEINDGKTYLMPTAYNAKGGGEHFDMSYNILGMVRDYSRNMVKIRTLKVKFQHLGSAGIDIYFGWNINNGRYTATIDHYDHMTNTEPQYKWDNKSWLFQEAEKEAIKEVIPTISPEDAFGEVNNDIMF